MRRRHFLASAPMVLLATTPARAHAEANSEAYLLHTLIPGALLKEVRIWNAQEDEWRTPRREELPRLGSAVTVLHFWAHYCAPCRQEFPILRDLAKQLEALYVGQVSFVYLCESSSSTEAGRFFASNRQSMPSGPHYQDSGEAIANLLRDNIPGGQLSLPTTVLLDDRLAIRQAVVGSIATHRGAIAAGIAKLVKLAATEVLPPSKSR